MDNTRIDRKNLSVPMANIRVQQNFVSKWYLPSEIELLIESANPGDILEFNRGLYTHWGIYAGKVKLNMYMGKFKVDVDLSNGVIHAFIPGYKFFLPSSNLSISSRFGSSLESDKAYVEGNELEEILGNSKVRINNSGDKNNTPFNPADIIDRAVKALGIYQDYSVLKNNCEHFVNICRYGIGNSNQVNNAMTFGGGLISALGIVSAVMLALIKK